MATQYNIKVAIHTCMGLGIFKSVTDESLKVVWIFTWEECSSIQASASAVSEWAPKVTWTVTGTHCSCLPTHIGWLFQEKKGHSWIHTCISSNSPPQPQTDESLLWKQVFEQIFGEMNGPIETSHPPRLPLVASGMKAPVWFGRSTDPAGLGTGTCNLDFTFTKKCFCRTDFLRHVSPISQNSIVPIWSR